MNRLVLVLVAVVLAGCNSTRPPAICEPEIVPKPYPLPFFVGVWIPPLPPMELPAYPNPPPPDASDEDIKNHDLEIARVAKERAAIRAARIVALELQIEANNDFATDHPAPEPPTE